MEHYKCLALHVLHVRLFVCFSWQKWLQSLFFSGPLGGEISPPKFWISPPNNNKFHLFFWIFFTFSLPTKAISPPKLHLPVQPVQETCNPAQTFDSFLNRTDVVHKDRQQGIPTVDTQTKTMRWTKLAPTRTEYNSSGRSQSAPVSPSLEKDSGRHTQHVTKPG